MIIDWLNCNVDQENALGRYCPVFGQIQRLRYSTGKMERNAN